MNPRAMVSATVGQLLLFSGYEWLAVPLLRRELEVPVLPLAAFGWVVVCAVSGALSVSVRGVAVVALWSAFLRRVLTVGLALMGAPGFLKWEPASFTVSSWWTWQLLVEACVWFAVIAPGYFAMRVSHGLKFKAVSGGAEAWAQRPGDDH